MRTPSASCKRWKRMSFWETALKSFTGIFTSPKLSDPLHTDLGILYSSLNGNAVKISLLPLCASWIKNSGSNSWPARVSETFYFYRGTIFLLLLAQKRRGHFFLCGSRLRLETMSFCCRVSFLRLYVRWPPYARDFDSLLTALAPSLTGFFRRKFVRSSFFMCGLAAFAGDFSLLFVVHGGKSTVFFLLIWH